MKDCARFFLAFLFSSLGYLLLLPVAAIALFKLIFNQLVQLLANRLEPAHIRWDRMIRFDPEIGWKPRANLDTYYPAKDDIYHVRTDHEGWPGEFSIEESDVIVFGDSFAFGHGIDAGKSFLNRDPRLRIKAIAAPGYNLVQELLLMRQYAEKLKNKLVVWFVYLENDIHDNLMPAAMGHYRTPFLRRSQISDEWKIYSDHLAPDPWRLGGNFKNYRAFLARLCSKNPLSERAFSACDFLIREARQVCHQSGAALLIVTIPYLYQLSPLVDQFARDHAGSEKGFDPDYPDKQLGIICNKAKVEFFPLKRILKVADYNQKEKIHWAEQGHLKIARFIAHAYLLHKNRKLPLLGSYGDGGNRGAILAEGNLNGYLAVNARAGVAAREEIKEWQRR